ncbi:Smr/MutS family protein [Yoonia sp. BS5-3]|uniref:Smr/MutS family protein n=1 Tax=Yoonia phaeophyticola TaxID=3137369 RepID=A0ABZ2V6P1_9RHOB
MRRPRHLSAEERALWDRVAERTTPIDPKPSLPEKPKTPAQTKPLTKEPAPRFVVGEKASVHRAHDILPEIADRLGRTPINMDHKSFGRMKRGKLSPEARIDLHGMTLAEAHPELVGFILQSQAAGRRLVLVITGKGKDRDDGGPIPTRYGVLRHQVPRWLALAPLAPTILQVTPAHQKHGGDGAYYVYLRRNR